MSDEPPNPDSHPVARPARGSRGGGPGSPEDGEYPKAELLPRLLARLTDAMIALLPPLLLRDGGGILGVLYLLFADGMFRGQSPGKKLLGIKVIERGTHREIDYRGAALRSFPFAVSALLWWVPEYGETLTVGAAAAVVAIEGSLALTDRLGQRAGDLFANTQVVDTKVLAAEPQQLRPLLKVVRSSGSSAARAAGCLRGGGFGRTAE